MARRFRPRTGRARGSTSIPISPNLNIAMPPPLTADGQVTYADGNPGDARPDGAGRLRLPGLDGRAAIWTRARMRASSTLIFLLFGTILAYMAYQNVWHGSEAAGSARPARSIPRTARRASTRRAIAGWPAELRPRRPPPDQHDRGEGQHRDVVLVGDRRLRAEGAEIGLASATASSRRSRRARAACRPDRPASASAVRRSRASRARPGSSLDDMSGDHRHDHRAGVPAARREPPEMGLGRRLVGKVEGLRIIFAREFEHLLAGHLVAAEQRSPLPTSRSSK